MIKNSRSILLISFIAFLGDVSNELIAPLLPLFIISLGGGGIAIGVLSGVGRFVCSLLTIYFGFLSDKTKKNRRHIAVGYVLSILSKLVLTISVIWPQVFVAEIIEQVGRGIRRPAKDAVVAKASFNKHMGFSFGIYKASDSLGAVIGSVLAYVLFWQLGLAYNTIFLLSALLIIPIGFLIFLLNEKQPSVVSDASFRENLKKLPDEFKQFGASIAVFSIANLSYMFFILQSYNVISKDPLAATLLLYVWFNVVFALSAMPLGMLSDKVGRKRIIAVGYCLFAVVSVGFGLTQEVFLIAILFGLLGLSYGCVDGMQRAYVVDLTPAKSRGLALGTYYAITGVFGLISGIIAGVVWQTLGPSTLFVFSAVVSILAIFVLYLGETGKFVKSLYACI